MPSVWQAMLSIVFFGSEEICTSAVIVDFSFRYIRRIYQDVHTSLTSAKYMGSINVKIQ